MIRNVCIVGAGTMGHQIALQCAVHGYYVIVNDVNPSALEVAQKKIKKILEDRVNKGETSNECAMKTMQRISFYSELRKAAEKADLVIEAVFENVEVKRDVFRKLDDACPSHTILASNTSSIRPSLLAEVTKRPEKVLAVNFGNPVWVHPCCEIMGTNKTSEETIKVVREFVKSIGITPILVKKEINGYAFNRVWRAIKKEALKLVDQGYISFEDLDRAFMINFGAPIGPFMLMDIIGLDVVKAIEEQYYRESGDPSDKPPKMLEDKVNKGELGIKTGKGFYTYPNPAYERPGWIKGE